MERFKKILLDHDIRPSHHRIKVLEYLVKNRVHPTADDIYSGMLKEMPTISKATVYNTLKVLQEVNLVRSFHVTGDEARYDYAVNGHPHFYCIRCGDLIDLDIECPYMYSDQIEGHLISEVRLFFRGVCKDCREKEETRVL